ncbi:hypothetical protein [Clostridium septicum]|uniref:hypothetical protein n=1 Tax=Clostridium septicum TaxID=1504 RepID=UPI00083231FC|nr:hypothetical protein [Clostridium septicum]
MRIISDRYRKKVEKDLKDYPYMVMALETEGLGYPTRWDIEKDYSNSNAPKGSFTEECAIDLDDNIRKVDIINRVLKTLDSTSKGLIEEWYFRGSLTQRQIEKELSISTGKYYKLRNSSLRKFAIALGYLKQKNEEKKDKK